MKTILLAAAGAVAMAGSAAAWEGKAVACYDKVWVPASYTTTKVLEYPAKMKWEHRNGQMVEMHYAPIYMEQKHLVKEGHYVLRKAPCK
jgi:hypothetical protein